MFSLGYQAFGPPFTLEFIIGGVAGVMILRYTASFSVAWLREILIVEYVRNLQTEAFDEALDTRIAYFDSDTVLNAIITQAPYNTVHTHYSTNINENGSIRVNSGVYDDNTIIV